jgi:GDP-L-fucose synthase
VKICVAGGTGLVGAALVKAYKEIGYDTVSISKRDVDLTLEQPSREMIERIKPTILVIAAAVVGGIGANNTKPVEFLLQNLKIQNNLMQAAHYVGVKKVIFLGSSCIYPRDCAQPIKEEYLLTGILEETNSAYAVAKIAGIELIKSYRKEYGNSWISLMPTNLYGPGDNFAREGSHVLPALIRKFVDGERENSKTVKLWGDGSPLREFLHVEDVARAVVLASKEYDEGLHLNIGSGEEISIKDLALIIAELSGFNGEVLWDMSRPNGTPRKVLDSSRMRSLGWSPQITLRDGIRSTINWYREAVVSGKARL